ncbi:ABC-F family ATP-binding cassette domain-containing protein [Lysinibacter cavernae]|uniref:Macrolide transport system ATP-binding/permease protein n=1 Tax=Lysinibacter cavernae TaxID=1640652 RepID=A0A7X5TS75_9MICO|nr:ATP-binding cassette domain-containing protein [Lysinibacter cavernae]NIH52630.1 macrolide transport system ATP-binding/permease protein [Lysinibacter cavernae]
MNNADQLSGEYAQNQQRAGLQLAGSPREHPAGPSAQLVATQIEYHYGHKPVLSNCSLVITPGQRWAVVGGNGRGKTTLIGLLAGELTPVAGSIRRIGTLGYVSQELVIESESATTVSDVVDAELAAARLAELELERSAERLASHPGNRDVQSAYSTALERAQLLEVWDADRRMEQALAGFGASFERARRLNELSTGQRHRLRLACVLGGTYDVVLLDEPTNHLDAEALRFLTASLRERTGASVVVSHDRALLRDVATNVCDVDPSRDNQPRIYGGGFDAFVNGRARELASWRADYEQQVAEGQRLESGLEQARSRLVSGWRPPKGTGKHTRATRAPALVRALHDRQREFAERAVDIPRPPLELRVKGPDDVHEGTLLTASHVRCDGRLDQDVSVALETGSRLVVTGPNGVGKSTLLRLLSGELEPSAGTVRTASGVRVGLLSQDSDGGEPVWTDAAVETVLELGLLHPEDTEKKLSELSVGQRRRVDLAAVFALRPHVLLLDEPTNHLSADLVADLINELNGLQTAVVVVSHDRQLLSRLSGWPRLSLTALG